MNERVTPPPPIAFRQGVDPALLELQSNKIQEMALVMRRAVELDEQSEHRAQEAIAQLTKENRVSARLPDE